MQVADSSISKQLAKHNTDCNKKKANKEIKCMISTYLLKAPVVSIICTHVCKVTYLIVV